MDTKFGDSRFSRSEDMIADIKIENESCDLDYASFRVVCYPSDRT